MDCRHVTLDISALATPVSAGLANPVLAPLKQARAMATIHEGLTLPSGMERFSRNACSQTGRQVQLNVRTVESEDRSASGIFGPALRSLILFDLR